MQEIGRTFSSSMLTAVFDFDDALIESILIGIGQNAVVAGVELENEKGEVIGRVGSTKAENSESFLDAHFHAEFDLRHEKEGFLVANVRLYSNHAVILKRLKYGVVLILINSIIKTVILWMVMIFFLRKYLSRPVLNIAADVDSLEFGNLKPLTHEHPHENELSRLRNAFNSLLERLAVSKESLANHQTQLERTVDLRTHELSELVQLKEAVADELRSANQELSCQQSSLEQSEAELTRSNRALRDFAQAAAHDIQTPLRHMDSFSKLVIQTEGDQLSEGGRDKLERIAGAAQRLRAMTVSLLEFSQVDETPAKTHAVDLTTVAKQVVRDLGDVIQNASGQVHVGELPIVQADMGQMYQILINMIGNALKFHRPGVPPIVKLSGVREDKERCKILVADNGIGFNDARLDRVLSPFQRLVSQSEFKGSGIGMGTVRGIVERHGGSIAATSTLGVGSTFIVTLPLATTAATDVSNAVAVGALKRRLVVLLVDDSPDDLKIAEAALEKVFNVLMVATGQEALRRLAEETVDAVLSDYRMPDMDGVELLRRVAIRFPSVRRILITSDSPTSLTSRIGDGIVEACLLKPVTSAQIDSCLGGASLSQED